jgi:hypothetical protein
MREMYVEEPNFKFTNNSHYHRLLRDLRIISKKFDLPFRTIEKALFKKNIEHL